MNALNWRNLLRFLTSVPKTIPKVLISYKNINYGPVILQNFAPQTWKTPVFLSLEASNSQCEKVSWFVKTHNDNLVKQWWWKKLATKCDERERERKIQRAERVDQREGTAVWLQSVDGFASRMLSWAVQGERATAGWRGPLHTEK